MTSHDREAGSRPSPNLPPLPISEPLWQAVAQDLALSPQHTRIVELVLRGMCDKQIAETLGISKSTLRTHWERIALRTGAKGRTAVLRMVLSVSHRVVH